MKPVNGEAEMREGLVWRFSTARFNVDLLIEQEHDYQYDGDDEGGETQSALDSGELVAFNSYVLVTLDGREVGRDTLGGSVYAADEVEQFWTAHRDPADAANRNCLATKARGICICHYFPDMVRSAIGEARRTVRARNPLPYIRDAA
jgi:hypothetical protein